MNYDQGVRGKHCRQPIAVMGVLECMYITWGKSNH